MNAPHTKDNVRTNAFFNIKLTSFLLLGGLHLRKFYLFKGATNVTKFIIQHLHKEIKFCISWISKNKVNIAKRIRM